MDILSIVTLVALVVAMGMLAITGWLLREERRRSDARVAALSSAAQSERESVPAREQPVVAREATPAREREAVIGYDPVVARERESAPDREREILPARPQPAPRAVDPAATVIRRHEAPRRPTPVVRPSLTDDFELYPSQAAAADEASPAGMFESSTRSRTNPGRLIPLAAGAVLVALVAIGVTYWSGARALESSDHDIPRAAAQPVSSAIPLELVALRHRRDGDRLAISGIVKNPAGARPIKNVTAVVFLFDENGSFLSSGRAPVDFTTLTPGDESPFVVVVSEPGAVARYRVSFRSDDHVVPHVDRRESPGPLSSGPAISRLRHPRHEDLVG